jgi:flagellar assembly protein FliH
LQVEKAEIPLSKIIKAFQLAKVRSFDFQEIERLEAAPGNGGAYPENEHTSTRGADPVHDMEQAIQRRLADAVVAAQETEKQGYQRGYEQGLQEGFETGRKTMADVQEQLEQLFLELQDLPHKVLQDYRAWFIDNVLAVSRQIVQAELRCRPDLLIKLIEEVLAEVERDHNFTLYLSPKDLKSLEQHSDQIKRIKESAGSLMLKPDPTLHEGGCRLESSMQCVDASLERQFALLEETLSNHGSPG